MAHAVELTPSEAEAPVLIQAGPLLQHPSRAESTSPEPDLASLYDSCGARVFHLALHLSRTSQEAEDLCHDVFLRFWQQGRYEPMRGPVLAYLLLLLTRSMAINRINQHKNRWQLLQHRSDQCCLRP